MASAIARKAYGNHSRSDKNGGHEGLFAVVIWISSTQIAGTFQANCVLRDRSIRSALAVAAGEQPVE